MVSKRSEYRREYKVSSLQRNIPVYFENVSYRHQRRELECAHTPLSWDFESSEGDTDSPVEEADKLPISEMKIVEEVEEEATAEEIVNDDEDSHVDQGEDDVEIIKQNHELTKSAKEKLNKYSSKENKDTPSPPKPAVSDKKEPYGKMFVKPLKVDEKTFIKKRPQRPDRLYKVPRLQIRPSSAPSNVSPSPQPAKKPPFAAYGSGGQDNTVGNKKTFNVRCSSAVYPAALRAKKRSALEIQQREERRKKASSQEKRKQALFNDKLMRETAEWQSEYQRNFPAYSNTIYERAASARSQFKQPSIFTPFMKYSVQ